MTGLRPWILVIDDDPWTREALGAILRRAGYRVTTAARFDPELAGGAEPPGCQVAVVDFHLPDLNGLEVARRLKELYPECRIVMISSEPPDLRRPGRTGPPGGPLPGQTFLQGRHPRGHRPTLPHHGRLIQPLFQADSRRRGCPTGSSIFVRREELFQSRRPRPGGGVRRPRFRGPAAPAGRAGAGSWGWNWRWAISTIASGARASQEDAAFVADLARQLSACPATWAGATSRNWPAGKSSPGKWRPGNCVSTSSGRPAGPGATASWPWRTPPTTRWSSSFSACSGAPAPRG